MKIFNLEVFNLKVPLHVLRNGNHEIDEATTKLLEAKNFSVKLVDKGEKSNFRFDLSNYKW